MSDEFDETIAGAFSHAEQHMGQEMYQAQVAKEQAIMMMFVKRAEFWNLMHSTLFFFGIPIYVVMWMGVWWVGKLVFG